MAFYKVDRTFSEIKELEAKSAPKLRYVIGKDKKGYWIRPKPPMPIDYCDDIPY